MPPYLNNLFEQVATAQTYQAAYALCKDIVNGAYSQSTKNHFNVVLGSLARADAERP
ncbi:MAG TPA: hypothetical protein VL155_10765 [Terriglobales bacterium]|jgi:hypothetical protein|nr:hypothetical protein [Terriglobales bacterium]